MNQNEKIRKAGKKLDPVFVPYRESKLTLNLYSAMQNSRVLMMVNISPETEDIMQSKNSLEFANSVRNTEGNKTFKK